MSEAFEVSPDDTAGVAEAIRRAAAAGTVRLVRDGHPVAEIVPPARTDTDQPWDTAAGEDGSALNAMGLAALEARMANFPSEAGRARRGHAQRFGAPTLAHYRRVYAQSGAPWPGEAFVRRHHPVADAS